MGTQRYTIDENGRKVTVPSVTTVLKYSGDKGGLMNWYFQQGKEAARLELEENHPPISSVWNLPKGAAEIGTVAHAMIEADLAGVEFARGPYSDEVLAGAEMAFSSWQRFKSKRSWTPIGTEVALSSVEHRYGGTMDCVSLDEERAITDWKTGKGIYAEHVMQIAAYLHLWRENRPDEPIDSVAILRLSKTDGSIHLHDWPADSPTIEAAWRGFLAARELYDVLTKHLKDVA